MKTIIRGGDNRVFKSVRERYSNLLRPCTKINSQKGKKSIVIKEEVYDLFLTLVLRDEQIDNETKVLVGFAVSTGLRITELLNLQIKQIDLNANRVKQIHIQKKRTKDLKLDKPIHPQFAAFLSEYIAKLPADQEKLVAIDNRFIALRRIKKYFGMTCHDFRHSYVNYFLSKNQKNGLERITKIMGWSSLSSSFSYSQNCDLDKEIDNFFEPVEMLKAA